MINSPLMYTLFPTLLFLLSVASLHRDVNFISQFIYFGISISCQMHKNSLCPENYWKVLTRTDSPPGRIWTHHAQQGFASFAFMAPYFLHYVKLIEKAANVCCKLLFDLVQEQWRTTGISVKNRYIYEFCSKTQHEVIAKVSKRQAKGESTPIYFL